MAVEHVTESKIWQQLYIPPSGCGPTYFEGWNGFIWSVSWCT